MPSSAAGDQTELRSLDLDLDVDARGKVEALERLHRLARRLDDVEKALVDAHLEVLARVLVDVRRAHHAESPDLRRQRHRTPHLRLRAHDRLDDLLRRLVDDLVVVGLEPDPDLLTLRVCHAACLSGSRLGLRTWVDYLTILVTTPEPTVRPPSRMANRRPSSMAIAFW